jgi:hypothetical protein
MLLNKITLPMFVEAGGQESNPVSTGIGSQRGNPDYFFSTRNTP